MNCPTDGVLRTFLDGELRGDERDEAGSHIQKCESCARRLEALQSHASRAGEDLAALGQGSPAFDPRLAYERFCETTEGRSARRAGWLRRLSSPWPRPAIGWAAAVLVAVVALGFSPGRTWAQKVLEMLRVQKIAVLPVDLSSVTLQDGFGRGGLIAKFLSDNVAITMQPGPSTVATDAAAASQLAGYNVRTIDALGAPQKIFVNGEGAFQMTLNREQLQTLLEQVGRSDVSIPASVDGSLIVVHVPKMVLTQYGSCGHSTNTEDCINFAQLPSPTVSVPPSLNIAALAEACLQLTGMTASQASAFSKNVDWTSTLVIPVPQSEATFLTVPVDGVSGALIESAPNGNFAAQYQLIWVKNGIVYSLEGQGSPNRALAAAGSLS